ncbi:SusC/RagA family TonB-linked outer membrane protein [soil metagenome]
MRKLLCGVLCLAIFCASAMAQKTTITGKVTDSSGAGIAGASVREKGTKIGVSADNTGAFTILVDPGTALIFSSTGFAEIQMAAANNMIVVLQSNVSNLTEVVVTALGITRSKNSLPYAAQKVNGADISGNRSSNFISSLSGKASGVEIRQNNTMGGSTNIVLRGAKSLTGTNQALFVIDGVPIDNTNNNTADQSTGRGGFDYGNAAADINPDNIESVTILKGANATALYGSRGFNGVILVTTKKGKKGFSVTVNSGVTLNSIDKSTFPTYQKKYGQGYGKYYSNSTNPNFEGADLDGDGVEDLISPSTEDASYGAAFDPNLMVYQWQSHDPTSPFYQKKQPWVASTDDPSAFFVNPVNFNNSVFLEAGGDKANFTMGYTKANEKGILPNSTLDKDLLNLSASYKITSKITVGGAGSYSRIAGKGRFGTGYDGANALNPMTNFRQWWNIGVNFDDLKAAYERNHQNITWNWADPFTLGFSAPAYWDNPYFMRYENVENDSRNRLFGNVYANYQIAKWLNVLGRISYDGFDEQEEERKAVTSVGVPFYRRFNQRYNEVNYDVLATGNWDLTEDLNFKALLGSTTRVTKRSSVDLSTNGGLASPGIFSIANSLNAPFPPTELEAESRVESGYAGVTFGYKNTLFLDGTGRVDRSSTLPKNNNTYGYYSASVGIVLSEMLKQDWLSYAKVRGSYASVGKDAPLYYVKDNYVYDIDPNSGGPVNSFNGNSMFSVPGTKNNPDLKPEKTSSFEAGLEASFFKSRVGFDLTYYDAKTKDQILPLTLSTSTGYSRKIVNSGVLRNRGVEISLYATPVRVSGFSWDVSVNWTRNRNKVESLYGDLDNIVLGSFQGSITVNASLGKAYGDIHGSDFVYLDGQKVVGANGRYVKSSSNNITIGNINADWIGGITNKVAYKGLALSFLIDVRQGGDVFSTDLYYGLATGLYPETAGNNDLGNPIRSTIADGGGIVREGVTADGKPNTKRAETYNYGAFGYRFSPDKPFVYDASYVKLREASISYSLPSKMFMNKIIQGIDLAIIGRNLWIIHKNLPYADPEENFGAGNLQGVQTGAYPTTRTIGFNVKLKL